MVETQSLALGLSSEEQARQFPLRPAFQTGSVDPLSIAPNLDNGLGPLYIGARVLHADGMSLALATPRDGLSYDDVATAYALQSQDPDFSDVEFWARHFDTPEPDDAQLIAPEGMSLEEYTQIIRPKFIHPSVTNGSFDIWLPYARSVAGAGRFSRHSFLWDGYHMAKGYAADGHWDLVLNIVDNTEYQINRYGYALNGSAGFLATRSQPPYFSNEVAMLADEYGNEALVRYLPAMEKEYEEYWMDGRQQLESQPDDGRIYTHRSLVRVPLARGGYAFLNRYWDDADGPRLESYQEDVELGEEVAHGLEGEERRARLQKLYKDIRAGAASGWDFCSRWFADGKSMTTINTTDILPVDLNSLLARTEHMLARAHWAAGDREKAGAYMQRLAQRAIAINEYDWDPASGIYRDFNFVQGRQTKIVSAAAAYPLYVGISNVEQSFGVAQAIESQLLFPGGVVATTTDSSKQQWDGGTIDGDGQKNVWAPLNWAAARALARSAHMFDVAHPEVDTEPLIELSERVRESYMNGVRLVFDTHRTVPEKHRGDDPRQIGQGGEYRPVRALAMPSEIFRAMDRWDPRDPAGCLPVGATALSRTVA